MSASLAGFGYTASIAARRCETNVEMRIRDEPKWMRPSPYQKGVSMFSNDPPNDAPNDPIDYSADYSSTDYEPSGVNALPQPAPSLTSPTQHLTKQRDTIIAVVVALIGTGVALALWTPIISNTTFSIPTAFVATATPMRVAHGLASTSTLQPTATAAVAPDGFPHVGGSLADFFAAYGQPYGHGFGGSDNFYADKAQTITLGVTFTNTMVIQVAVLGPTWWTKSQTFTYCTNFLPSDAVKFNSVAQYTDYRSSIGQITIAYEGYGACLVSSSQA